MIAHKHILGTFDESLAALRNNVLMMAGLTERSLERAMKGLVNRDDNICATAIADVALSALWRPGTLNRSSPKPLTLHTEPKPSGRKPDAEMSASGANP